MASLVIDVRLHDGRYHGMGEKEPSPSRLFQALVAGAACGAELDRPDRVALAWLEGLRPPVVGLPHSWPGQPTDLFVPNNDLDSVDGDLRDIGMIRSTKVVMPRFFNQETPFLFGWAIDSEDEHYAGSICSIVERLYQFGRGIDMAWAWATVLDEADFEKRLAGYPGRILRPSERGGRISLPCPQPGSLESLQRRHDAHRRRFALEGTGRNARRSFTQPPKALFAQVRYEAKSDRRIYDLRRMESDGDFEPWPIAMIAELATKVRDGATKRLRESLPDEALHVETSLVGRKADGSDAGPTSARIRVVPLPSIGHAHADLRIRRIMVDVPAECPLSGGDVHWAFSGLGIESTGGFRRTLLVQSEHEGMVSNYVGQSPGHRRWRTVTPVVLPTAICRRRIEPTRRLAEAKEGKERAQENGQAVAAIAEALRHADVRVRARSVRVQREPFTGQGERVERFAPGTRFSKEQLWHAEVTFEEPVEGPLVIGNGRFVGLGIMEPVRGAEGVIAFDIADGLVSAENPHEISGALRRAVMARAQEVLGRRERLPTFFTGHDDDGAPAVGVKHTHVSCVFDPLGSRLLVFAPHTLDHREPTPEESSNTRVLDKALLELRELRAGRAGKLVLTPAVVDMGEDLLFRPSRVWKTATPYLVNRHLKGIDAGAALQSDLLEECRRRGLPIPDITTQKLRGLSGSGLSGHVLITFKVAVPGPIILGRGRYFGLGLFVAVPLSQ